MVSDWADGQRPKRGRGRIYHIAYTGTPPKSKVRFNLPGTRGGSSHYGLCDAQEALVHKGKSGWDDLVWAVRNGGQNGPNDVVWVRNLDVHWRQHAIWALAQIDGSAAVEELMRVAQRDKEPSVR